MKIAIPVENSRLSDHFGHCRHFSICTVPESREAPFATEVLEAPPHEPGSIPRWLRDLQVDVVLAGGMGHKALQYFEQLGIKAITGVAPATPDDLVAAYVAGTLVSGPNSCSHTSEHHC